MSQSDHAEVPGLPAPVGQAVHRLLPLVKTAVLLVSIAAAVPTARNLYYSWSHGIPFTQVSHRLNQYELWMRNLDCKIEYRALSTAVGGRVDVGACPKTGDIAIKISGQNGAAAYEWIAFDQLQKPKANSAGLLDLIFTPAYAEAGPSPGAAGPLSFKVAQAGMEVLCQVKQGDKIVRVVKDGAKCYREVVSPLRGTIERRQEVSCSTKC